MQATAPAVAEDFRGTIGAEPDLQARLPAAADTARYQPLVIVVLAIVAGIVLDFYSPVPIAFGFAWFIAAGCVFIWWIAWRCGREFLAAWLLLVAAAMTGAAWHHARWQLFDRSEIGRFVSPDSAPVCMEVIARQSPERVSAPPASAMRAIPVGEKSRLLVSVVKIRDGAAWRPASGVCQLSVDGHLLGVHAGDRLQVFGRWFAIAPPFNPGEFDFAAHARADRQFIRIHSSLPECVAVLDRGSDWSLVRLLDEIRSGAKEYVKSFVGQHRAGIADAILLGAREGLPFEETESYMVTGTIHFLVVAGLHVAILAAGLVGLMRMGWIPRRAGLALIVMAVIGYALLADAHPSVVRAASLYVLIWIAAWAGRSRVGFNSLCTAALLVLAMNPNDLFRTGPQLSFLAVATLIWADRVPLLRGNGPTDRLDELIAMARPWYWRALSHGFRWAGGLMLTSTVIWLAALPLVMRQYHLFSPVAIFISPLIWGFFLAAMWSGFAMLSFGWLLRPVGLACGAVCSFSIGGMERLVRWAEAAPGGHAWVPGPASWWVLVFYVGLVAVMIWGKSLIPRRWQLAALCFWVLVGLAPAIVRGRTHHDLECSFVAVGHGECVVLESPNGQTLLYDAGAMGAPEYATQSIASFLWDRGIMHLEGIVISHADTDHYNAVPGLLERFRVGAVYVSPVMFRSFNEEGPNALRDAIRQSGVPIREVWSGDLLHMGPDVSIRVMHPPKKGVVGSDNANSITMGVEYAGRRVLLPGDLESPGIDDVMAESPYDCDVLLAPHHGSRRSDPPGFSAWSLPEWVVISSGSNDQVEPVIQTYKRVGANVLVTNEVGLVHLTVRPDSSFQVTNWRQPGRLDTAGGDRP